MVRNIETPQVPSYSPNNPFYYVPMFDRLILGVFSAHTKASTVLLNHLNKYAGVHSIQTIDPSYGYKDLMEYRAGARCVVILEYEVDKPTTPRVLFIGFQRVTPLSHLNGFVVEKFLMDNKLIKNGYFYILREVN